LSKILITVILFATLQSLCKAQTKNVRPSENRPKEENTSAKGLSVYRYFSPEEKYNLITEADTSLEHTFTRFDPTKRSGNEHITLGNTFSAAYRLLYDPRVNVTFHHGYDQYKVYAKNFDNFLFYTSETAKSDVFFSQFANQLNYSAGARMAIPFQSGWSLSLDYFRVNEKGFYVSQAIKSTNLSAGLQYSGPGERYQFVAGFAHHAQDEENNGGITDIDELISRPSGAVRTFLNGAKTRQQERNIFLVQYLTIAGSPQWKLYARNTLLYNPSYYKFSHATQLQDTLYYGSFLSDTRGVRRFLDIEHGRAGFYLHGESLKGLKGNAGLQLDHFIIEDQGYNRTRSDLTAVFNADIPLLKSLVMQTKGALGLANNAGNFDLSGQIQLKTGKWAQLTGEARFYLSEPAYAQQNLIINRVPVFEKSWKKSFGTSFSGHLLVPATRTKISFIQSVLTNPVFWAGSKNDNTQINIESFQSDNVLSYTSLRVFQELSFYNFEFNHGIFFQIFNENLYNLPTWYSSHQLYYQYKIFKKALQLSIGGEVRFVPSYNGVGYSPLHGQFFTDNQSSFPLFPDLDLVLNAKIKTFRISLMIENAGQWMNTSHNFDVRDYPRMDPLLRFSVRWMFNN
jgi:hypothetical protein